MNARHLGVSEMAQTVGLFSCSLGGNFVLSADMPKTIRCRNKTCCRPACLSSQMDVILDEHASSACIWNVCKDIGKCDSSEPQCKERSGWKGQ